MKRHVTNDRRGVDPPRSMTEDRSVLTNEQIGPKRHMTREGFLLCEDVPIARVGWMIYGDGETPIKIGPDGYAMVSRDSETLFDPATILSFAGKAVTNDHPPNGVDSSNWKHVAVGTSINPRRGTGDDADVILCDLLITDAKAIKDVQSGKREVSAGYEADYKQTGMGTGSQLHIIGNHIALVERGRCGPRCAIGDRKPSLTERKSQMGTQVATRRRVSDAVRQRVLDQALAAAEAALDENGDEADEHGNTDQPAIHVHLHGTQDGSSTEGDGDEEDDAKAEALLRKKGKVVVKDEDMSAMDARMGKMEDCMSKMEKTMDSIAVKVLSGPGHDAANPSANENAIYTGSWDEHPESKATTGDSIALETGFKALMAEAEVLVPGFQLPTFDAAAVRKVTVDSMCATRRKVLDTFAVTVDGALVLTTLNGGTVPAMATMDCGQIATMFRAAAGVKKTMNNGRNTNDAAHLPANVVNQVVAKGTPSIADINKQNREFWNKKQAH